MDTVEQRYSIHNRVTELLTLALHFHLNINSETDEELVIHEGK